MWTIILNWMEQSNYVPEISIKYNPMQLTIYLYAQGTLTYWMRDPIPTNFLNHRQLKEYESSS